MTRTLRRCTSADYKARGLGGQVVLFPQHIKGIFEHNFLAGNREGREMEN